MSADGKGLPKDDSEARRLFRFAAMRGHPQAQYNLGGRRPSGDIVTDNENRCSNELTITMRSDP
ncbi:MAG: hypothetical protein GVY22_13420 [Gammaproteobacteria bacterium]|nr:hypothetical protein [Gammaproteobacteria bacterium]